MRDVYVVGYVGWSRINCGVDAAQERSPEPEAAALQRRGDTSNEEDFVRFTGGSKFLVGVFATLMLVFAAACGSDDDSAAPLDNSASSVTDDADGSQAGGDSDSAEVDDGEEVVDIDDENGKGNGQTAGGASTLIIDGEEISVDKPLCYLRPQEAAAGGGNILATAQMYGTNSEGEQVHIDFTRFDEDSMFHGDIVDVNIGEIMSAENYQASLEEGAISVDGGIVRGDNVVVEGGPDFSEFVVSFVMAC